MNKEYWLIEVLRGNMEYAQIRGFCIAKSMKEAEKILLKLERNTQDKYIIAESKRWLN